MKLLLILCNGNNKMVVSWFLSSPLVFFSFFLLFLHNGSCMEYKVGDLDGWGIPPSSKPHLYELWSQLHHFHMGDSLLFLYPPSEDSVIQVTERAYNTCSIADPIMELDDGNSVFYLSAPGYYYFTSGVPGHCQKRQRLAVAVPSANGTFFPTPTSEGPVGSSASISAAPASAPSYPLLFGPSAAQESAAAPAAALVYSVAVGSLLAFVLVRVLAP